jgi:hypothetical protein
VATDAVALDGVLRKLFRQQSGGGERVEDAGVGKVWLEQVHGEYPLQ